MQAIVTSSSRGEDAWRPLNTGERRWSVREPGAAVPDTRIVTRCRCHEPMEAGSRDDAAVFCLRCGGWAELPACACKAPMVRFQGDPGAYGCHPHRCCPHRCRKCGGKVAPEHVPAKSCVP
jgi:hypothetical protein